MIAICGFLTDLECTKFVSHVGAYSVPLDLERSSIDTLADLRSLISKGREGKEMMGESEERVRERMAKKRRGGKTKSKNTPPAIFAYAPAPTNIGCFVTNKRVGRKKRTTLTCMRETQASNNVLRC